ncbi:MAG: acetyl-CoA carboxylase biotin carboxyl carrier protein subunit [Candidatus Binatia bacterium]
MPRTFIAKFEEREVPVEIEAASGGAWKVKIGDAEHLLDSRTLAAAQVSLLENGKNHEVYLHRAGDAFDCLIANQRYRFTLLTEQKARRLAARGGEEQGGRREIKASMPGKVVDVLVAVGDKVEPKQGILIIEAMKMENEIKTPGAGEVKEIAVKPGQTVEAGELLLVIE